MRTARRLRRLAAAAAVAVLVVPAGAAAEPRTSGELLRELERTSAESAQWTSELHGLRGQLADAEEELALLGVELEDARDRLVAAEGQVTLAEAALRDARAAQADADDEHRQAEALREAAEDELARHEDLLARQVIDSFKYGSIGTTSTAAMLTLIQQAEDPMSVAVGMRQLQVVVDEQGTTVRDVAALRTERAELADDAARARAEAAQAADDAQRTWLFLDDLHAQAAALAAGIAQDEQRQQDLVLALQASTADVEAVVSRIEAREDQLRRSLAEQRAREQAASLAAAGVTGGPPVPGGIVCPVPGVVAGRNVINDWGFPRSGGRFHQGNDLFAARGTPVVAVADGVVVRMNPPGSASGLGGITVTYRTAEGSEWYNAHLDTIAVGLRVGDAVVQGQPVGTVGNTGNARGASPHLHLGRRYVGQWVNPWPTISAVCR